MHILSALLTFALLLAPMNGSAADDLPTLGNASSNLISIEKERQLGTAWLAALRGQVETYEQPIVEDYLERLIYTLAPNSDVVDRQFRFVILDSSQLNAFAVPGSVVGINAGLFLHAGSEQEFASVMAHELAHLSQRHYARRLEKQQQNAPLTLAGVLASVVLAATTGADAGLATLASTQALSVEKSLSYSRSNEEEADRIGIETMYASNFNPRAMPVMFERMLKNARLQGSSLPEYLSTHPLSENRVADTRNRAEQFPKKQYSDSLEFHISKAIVTVDYAESKTVAERFYRSVIEQQKHANIDAARFGLAYALLDSKPIEAAQIFTDLLEKYPGNIAIEVSLAKASYLSDDKQRAFDRLSRLLEFNPDNYPASLLLAELHELEQNYTKSETVLIELSRAHPENPLIWYLLAEIHGQVGDIVSVHRARAEFFILTGRLDRAIEQLEFGIKKAKPNSRLAVIMKEQLDAAFELKENSPF